MGSPTPRTTKVCRHSPSETVRVRQTAWGQRKVARVPGFLDFDPPGGGTAIDDARRGAG